MEKEDLSAIDVIIKILPSVITFLSVIIGVWQFNKGQKQIKEREIEQRKYETGKLHLQASLDALAKFKEQQIKVYAEAASIISFLISNHNFKGETYQQKIERFWQLYWVELSAVESADVEDKMCQFGEILKSLQENDFASFDKNLKQFQTAGYDVAQAIKTSARSREMPFDLAIT